MFLPASAECADLPPATVEKLRTLSTYKIDPAMWPQEMHQSIFKIISYIKPVESLGRLLIGRTND